MNIIAYKLVKYLGLEYLIYPSKLISTVSYNSIYRDFIGVIPNVTVSIIGIDIEIYLYIAVLDPIYYIILGNLFISAASIEV